MRAVQPTRIIVVEDNEQMSEMIVDYLGDKFPQAVIKKYSTAEKALEDLNAPPDLFILDYNLDSENPAAMNGLQFLFKIKKDFDVPVVFLSAQERTDVSASIIKYGAYDYVVKNQESFHRLEIIVKNIIENQNVKRELIVQRSSIRALIVILVSFVAVLVLLKFLG